MDAYMRSSINLMANEISARLDGEIVGIWLYGSVCMDDFHLGWSDIDFIALASGEIDEDRAEKLLMLRQELSQKHPENPYFRLFEGVIMSLDEYRKGEYKRLIYWGTSGQRITDRFALDPFARYELARFGKCVLGNDDKSLFPLPEKAELISAVKRHYEGIRQYAVKTDESLYSCGWLLDILRCIHTLRCGGVITKTAAAEWALENRLFKDDEPLRRTLEIRKAPLAFKERADIKAWLASLGDTVQRYADALENELGLCGE